MDCQSVISVFQQRLSSIGDARLVAVTLLGSIGILVGITLPWIQPNPSHEVIRLVYVPGMSSGLEIDTTLVILLLLIISVAVGVLGGRSRLTGALILFIGLSAVALPAFHLIDSYVAYGGNFIPDVGGLVTIFSGILLFIAGMVMLDTSVYTRS